MADLIIPAKHRLALALREPNLLVPGLHPIGSIQLKSTNLARKLQRVVIVHEGRFIAFGKQVSGVSESVTPANLVGSAVLTPYGCKLSAIGDYITGNGSPLFSIASGQDFAWFSLVKNKGTTSSNAGMVRSGVNFFFIRSSSAFGQPWIYYSGLSHPATGLNEYQNSDFHLVRVKSGSSLEIFDDTLYWSKSVTSTTNAFTVQNIGFQNGTSETITGDYEIFGFFDELPTDAEAELLRRDPYGALFEPANQTPYLISVPAGGPNYDETFTASAAADLALTNTWTLNYSETFTAGASADLALTDEYASPSINYDETFTASAAADLALSDAWALNYAEAFAAGAVADLLLSDAWALGYAETFTASASADLALTDAYAVGNNYAETFTASAAADLALTDVWAPNYTETFAASTVSGLALTDTWQLDYAETFAASSIAELLLSDAYDSPAPGAFDETFSAASLAELSLYNTFTTPNALPVGISALTAERLSGIVAKLIN